MVQAGLPGRQHVVAAGPARSRRPVPGQAEARLLAQRREPVPGTDRPVGVGLVGQQFPVLRQRGGELVIPELAGRQREPGAERSRADLGIDDDVGRCPDMPQVGRQQRGAVRAELGERAARHGQRLRQCAGGGARIQAREELLAREIPADPATGADQDELAQAAGARPRPRVDDAATRADAELAEQLDLDSLAH